MGEKTTKLERDRRVDRKDIYLESKRAVTSLVDVTNQHLEVPACPDWRIRDVLAHLVGQLEDIVAGNTAGGGTDAWTAAQVERFASCSLADMSAAWDNAIVDAGDQAGDILRMIVPDLIVHEFDIRGALGNRDNRDHPGVLETAKNFIEFQQETFASSGLPAVLFNMNGHQVTMGEGLPGIELKAPAFEVTRMIFGRRSRNQILALDWSRDPARWLDHILLVPPRETDLVE